MNSDFIAFSDGSKKAAPVGSAAPAAASTEQQQQQQKQQVQFRGLQCEVLRTALPPQARADDGGSGSDSEERQQVEQLHAMFHLAQPVTLRAPCAIIGIAGQCLVQGFHLRQRTVILDGAEHVAVQPLPKDGGSNGSRKVHEAAVAAWGPCSASAATLNHIVTGAPIIAAAAAAASSSSASASSSSAAANVAALQQDLRQLAAAERRFGKINWSWVRQTLSDMSRRAGAPSGNNAAHSLNDQVIVLVLTTSVPNAPPAEEQQQQQQTAAASLPFFAPFMAPVPHNVLQDSLFPALLERRQTAAVTSSSSSVAAAAAPCVLVAGAVNTGKSTTCRFVANSLLSLYGECLWMDLDLGQSEFSPPGGVGLFRIRHPLFGSNRAGPIAQFDANSAPAPLHVERVAFHFLGAPTMRDPVAMAVALESLCRRAEECAAAGNTSSNLKKIAGARRGRQQQQKQSLRFVMDAADYEHDENREDDSGDDEGRVLGSGRRRQQVPIIINTHGWVLSTGRRATLEVLQRMRPDQVIHLVAPNGGDDSRWLMPQTAASSASNNNSSNGDDGNDNAAGTALRNAVSAQMFCAPTMASMLQLQHQGNVAAGSTAASWGYTLHRVSLDRLFDKDASDNRARMWMRYFAARWFTRGSRNDNDGNGNGSDLALTMLGNAAFSTTTTTTKTTTKTSEANAPGFGEVSIPLSRVRLVFTEEDSMPWSLRGKRTRLLLAESATSSSASSSLLAELRETLHCGLVGVALAASNNSVAAADANSLLVEQMCAVPAPLVPNVAGFALALTSDTKNAAATVTLVGPRALIDAVQRQRAEKPSARVCLVLGWQQFDAAWSGDMAKRAQVTL